MINKPHQEVSKEDELDNAWNEACKSNHRLSAEDHYGFRAGFNAATAALRAELAAKDAEKYEAMRLMTETRKLLSTEVKRLLDDAVKQRVVLEMWRHMWRETDCEHDDVKPCIDATEILLAPTQPEQKETK